MNNVAKNTFKTWTVGLLSLFSVAAWAHPGHAAHLDAGVGAGFLHPFLGWDHLLAMMTVGAWAVSALPMGRRWRAPVAFLAALLLGACLPRLGVLLPGAEQAVALSVTLLGAMWLAGARVPGSLGLVLLAAAGVFHGYAHGAEMLQGVSFAGYAAGFMLGSALMHVVGWAAGLWLTRLPVAARQVCAALVGVSGLAMLVTRL